MVTANGDVALDGVAIILVLIIIFIMRTRIIVTLMELHFQEIC